MKKGLNDWIARCDCGCRHFITFDDKIFKCKNCGKEYGTSFCITAKHLKKAQCDKDADDGAVDINGYKIDITDKASQFEFDKSSNSKCTKPYFNPDKNAKSALDIILSEDDEEKLEADVQRALNAINSNIDVIPAKCNGCKFISANIFGANEGYMLFDFCGFDNVVITDLNVNDVCRHKKE